MCLSLHRQRMCCETLFFFSQVFFCSYYCDVWVSEWLFFPITFEAEQNSIIILTDLQCLGSIKFIADPEEGVAKDSFLFKKVL